MLRHILSILSLLILLYAVFHFVRVNTNNSRSPHPAPPPGKLSPVVRRHRPSNSVRVLKRDAIYPSDQIQHGDELLVMHQVENQHECVLGTFIVSGTTNEAIFLKSREKLRRSKLELWAQQNTHSIKWFLVARKTLRAPHPFRLTCDLWFPAKTMNDPLVIDAKTNQIFLKASEFLFVSRSNENQHHTFVKSDLLRGGWLVSGPAGRHTLLIQSARTGLIHVMNINFPDLYKSKRLPRVSRSSKVLHKSFTLPGWD